MLTKSRARQLTDAQLRWTWNDCENALNALPDNPNAGRYLDEQHAVNDELRRRAKRTK